MVSPIAIIKMNSHNDSRHGLLIVLMSSKKSYENSVPVGMMAKNIGLATTGRLQRRCQYRNGK